MGVVSEALIDEAGRAPRRRGEVSDHRPEMSPPRPGGQRHLLATKVRTLGSTLRPTRSVPALMSCSSRVASEFDHACRRAGWRGRSPVAKAATE